MLLIPNGDSFARLAPFENRPTGWDGQLQIDVEAGRATPTGLDDHLEQGAVEGSTAVVIVTTEGSSTNSVHGTRLAMHISLDQPGFRVARIEWSNACQPTRGHQDHQPEYCT
jgi:hypothetical protein